MRVRLLAFAVLLCALPARGDDAGDAAIAGALMTLDEPPSVADLSTTFSTADQAISELSRVAGTAGLDLGLRIRAIRTLPAYCPQPAGSCGAGTPVHDTLTKLIGDLRALPQPAATDLMLLRAAVEALGATGPVLQADVDLMLPLLSSTSRDVRATVVQALRTACGTEATTALKTLGVSESSMQVRFAIMSALQTLEQCPPP
ncbi:MAG TPA: HEAT repeat domain-containing protein [Kofleriaceae bacterium]|nr:HEAT repeat domain-containing protein [Kofleriaceae bacterium]